MTGANMVLLIETTSIFLAPAALSFILAAGEEKPRVGTKSGANHAMIANRRRNGAEQRR